MDKTRPDFDALCEQAGRYFADGKMENALDCYRDALDWIETKEGLNQEKFKILNNVGMTLVRLRKFDMAVTAFIRARDISSVMGDKRNAAWQMGNIGSVFRDMKQYDSALQHYRDSLTVFEEMEDTYGIASQCSNVAYILAMKGEKEKALEWFEKAKNQFEASDSHEQADLALQNINALRSTISSGD